MASRLLGFGDPVGEAVEGDAERRPAALLGEECRLLATLAEASNRLASAVEVSVQQMATRAEAQGRLLAALAEALVRIADTNSGSAIDPISVSLDEAARLTGLRRATIDHLIETRQLAYVQVGAQRVRAVRVEDLRAFMLSRRQPTGDEARRRRGGRQR
jgi:hypothetical protein